MNNLYYFVFYVKTKFISLFRFVKENTYGLFKSSRQNMANAGNGVVLINFNKKFQPFVASTSKKRFSLCNDSEYCTVAFYHDGYVKITQKVEVSVLIVDAGEIADNEFNGGKAGEMTTQKQNLYPGLYHVEVGDQVNRKTTVSRVSL